MKEQKTPKEILKKHYDIMCEDNREDWAPFEEHGDSINCMLAAMQEFSDQQNVELHTQLKRVTGKHGLLVDRLIKLDKEHESEISVVNQQNAELRERLQWTSIKDKLPEERPFESYKVLTYGNWDDECILLYQDKSFYDPDMRDENGDPKDVTEHVTHWMYLPELPI